MNVVDKLRQQQANQMNKNANVGQEAQKHITDAPQGPESTEPVVEGEKTYDYATPHSDGYSFYFADGSFVQTENGVMRLNQTQHDEIQTLIKKHRRHDIAQNMVLVDRDAAEKAARAYLAQLEGKKQGHAGASSTGQRHNLTQQLGQQEVRNLDAEQVDISQLSGGESSVKDADLAANQAAMRALEEGSGGNNS